jgi:REP element-mobilizing transposase RayT
LTNEMCDVGDRAVVQLCDDREWKLLARKVRPTHVHVLANCRGGLSPERAMAQFKARITRDLRWAGLAASNARVWTDHGSTRWINSYPGLYAAIAYVNEWQSGPNRAILEEHKRLVREQMESLKAWLIGQGLPEDGRTVVAGETEEERSKRVRRKFDDVRNEHRTQ